MSIMLMTSVAPCLDVVRAKQIYLVDGDSQPETGDFDAHGQDAPAAPSFVEGETTDAHLFNPFDLTLFSISARLSVRDHHPLKSVILNSLERPPKA